MDFEGELSMKNDDQFFCVQGEDDWKIFIGMIGIGYRFCYGWSEVKLCYASRI